MSNHFRFKLGCDPEMFLADLNGGLKASCGLIGGSKEHPQPLTALGEGFAVQEDNVAIEFNIPPAPTMREFVESITKTIKVLNDGVNASYGFTLDRRSAAYFPKEELTSEAALVFGCDPDFNAWSGEVNPKPKAADETLRSCGGHIHVGYDISVVEPKTLIKYMDLFLGVPSILMDEGTLRKELYGKAGAYRPKSYGAEYRTLSNFWIHHPKLIEWAWKQTAVALEKARSNTLKIDAYRNDIESAINKNDKNAAWTMVKELGLEVVSV